MTLTPKLSICVPSRNRQKYFKQTIAALLRSLRLDVEFVFADNSDDPSIMNDYMVEVARDPRVVYLPSTGQTLSMVDNWERTMAASTGAWIIFIGDDDYVDPDVVSLISRSEVIFPNLDGVTWSLVHYRWPTDMKDTSNIFVPFKSNAAKISRQLAISRMFGWQDSSIVPTSGFSIYHSAISRRVMEKIRNLYDGQRYFEHPTVDYDNAMKVIISGENFVFCSRPFGILGVCPESNSFAVGRLGDMKEKIARFKAEVGRDIDVDDYMAGFPFTVDLGLTSCIAQVQHWFKKKYKLSYTGWQRNFVRACAKNVEVFTDPEAFYLVKDAYTAALTAWEGGRYLRHFAPRPPEQRIPIIASGSTAEGIYIASDIAGTNTPAGIYSLVNDICAGVEAIEFDAHAIEIMTKKLPKTSKGMAGQ